MSDPWILPRTNQCRSCPHIKKPNPTLVRLNVIQMAIGDDMFGRTKLQASECRETPNAVCVGWIAQQIKAGNQPLKTHLRSCINGREIRLRGDQRTSLEE